MLATFITRPALLAATLSATVYTVVQGLTYPLFALLLEQRGAPGWQIGISAAMMPLGMVLAGAGAPPLIRFLGARSAVSTCFALTAVSILLAKVSAEEPVLWLPLRLIMGFALACVFTVTETWVNELAPSDMRGQIVGVYSAVLSIGFALGPALLAVVGSAGWAPFLAGFAASALAFIPIAMAWKQLPDRRDPERRASAWGFARLAPALVIAVGAVAFAEQALMSFVPVWALSGGVGDATANTMLAVMAIGSTALTFPIGWLADRLGSRHVAMGCAVTSCVCGCALAAAGPTHSALWPLIFILGGAYYGIYVMALVRLGEQASGQLLIAGTAAFGAAWGAGGVLGPPVVGGAMDQAGAIGLPLAIAVLFGGLLLIIVLVADTVRGQPQPQRSHRAGTGPAEHGLTRRTDKTD